MKILHVSNGYPLTDKGGIAEYVRLLAHALSKKYKISVFAREWTYGGNDYSVRSIKDKKVVINYINNNIAYPSDFRLSYINSKIDKIFEEELLKQKPDIIHFHHLLGLSANFPLIAYKLNIPFLFTIHDYWYICPCLRLYTQQGHACSGNNPECVKDYYVQHPAFISNFFLYSPRFLKELIPIKIKREIKSAMTHVLNIRNSHISSELATELIEERTKHFRNILRLGRIIIVPTKFAEMQYSRFGINKKLMVQVPLGINTEQLYKTVKVTSNKIRFAYLGNLYDFKGVGVFVNAFNSVNERLASLTIYGDPNMNPGYFRELKKIAKHKRISFAGPYNHESLSRILGVTDVVVIPSLWPENFTLVAREAQATKTPLIVSNIGALPEVVTDGVNGYLFPPGNATELFKKIDYIIMHPQILKSFARRAKKPISIQEDMILLEKVYKKMLQHD